MQTSTQMRGERVKTMSILSTRSGQRVTRVGGFFVVASLIVALGGCAKVNDARSGSAREQLQEAAQATLSLSSFRVTATTTTAPDPKSTVTVTDYNAPDRVRILQGSDLSPQLIVIGSSSYSAIPEYAGFYYRARISTEGIVRVQALLPLEILQNSIQVTSENGIDYVFDGSTSSSVPNAVSGTARVSAGRVVAASINMASPGQAAYTIEYVFTMADSAPEVSAPAEDHVREAPTLPECPSTGPILSSPVICFPASSP